MVALTEDHEAPGFCISNYLHQHGEGCTFNRTSTGATANPQCVAPGAQRVDDEIMVKL